MDVMIAPPRVRLEWSQEAESLLSELYGNGVSCALIVAKLKDALGVCVSRNAVIGKVHRMRLPSRPTVIHKLKSLKPVAPRQRPKAYRELVLKRAEAPSVDDHATPFEQRKTLIELNAGHCRWPVGDVSDPGFFFCGGEAEPGCSYCAGHLARSLGKRPKTRSNFVHRGWAA